MCDEKLSQFWNLQYNLTYPQLRRFEDVQLCKKIIIIIFC